ncbi:MAG: esterase [Gammaproteobacteria bacterium]|nr:esterase [Gammaproteobacteria bacterium]
MRPIPIGILSIFFLILNGMLINTEAVADSGMHLHPPRIALVLSGGGARGAAHIGVLKVLEELRVPVDLVIGTSMGALVGGLYAQGMSPRDIEKTFDDIDWGNTFSGRPPRDNVSFRQKQDDDEALFQFELGISKKGIVLPTELVTGQKLSLLLTTLFQGTIGIDDFNQLPLPFRAIATDISSDEVVTLGKGNLSEAISASMAVPGVLPAVEIGGRTLVDGGVVRNLPIDVAQNMGAERVIAVDVSSTLNSLEGGSIVGVAAQTFRLLTVRNVAQQRQRIRTTDLLLTPDLSMVQFADFSNMQAAVAQGEAAARAAGDELSKLSLSKEAYSQYRKRQRRRNPPPALGIRIDEIEVLNLQRIDPRIITWRMKTRAGEMTDVRTLEQDVRRIYETGDFQAVYMRLIQQQEMNRLVIDAREKPWGPNYLRFGMRLESNLEGQGNFTLLANLRSTHLNRWGAEWKNKVKVGDNQSIFSEWYQPLSYSGAWFIAPSVELIHEEIKEALSTEKFDTVLGNIGIGYQQRNLAQYSIAWLRAHSKSKFQSILDDGEIKIDIGGAHLLAIYDQLDNANFPRHGTFAAASLLLSREGLGADIDYDLLELDVSHAQSVGRHTLVGSIELGTGLGSDIPFFIEFERGGFLDLSGLDRGALRGDVAGLMRLVYFQQVGRIPSPLGEAIYIGFSAEAGNVWESNKTVDLGNLRYAGSLFAGLGTVLGPVYLGYGRADGGEDSFYLFLGQPF